MNSNWRPIETAPRDGSIVQLLGKNGKHDVGCWCELEGFGEFVPATEFGESPHLFWRPFFNEE